MVTENNYRKRQYGQKPGGTVSFVGRFLSIFGANHELIPGSSPTNAYDSDGVYSNYPTAASNGSVTGIVPTESPVGSSVGFGGFQRIASPIFYGIMKTGPDVSSAAWHFGVTSYEPTTPDAVQHEAKLWYDTDSHSDGFWRCVTDNASGSPEITVTTLSVSVDQRLKLKIDMRDQAQIVFTVNGVVLATHTSVLPTSTSYMNYFAVLKARSGSSRNIKISRLVITHK